MQNGVIKIYKKKGETPLRCIQNLKNINKSLNTLPMTYAGRLDPLAEGILLILAGDEVNKKDEYLKLEKEYEVDILFGFATDTYDILGKVTNSKATPELLFKRSSDEGDGSRCQTILNSNSGYTSKINYVIRNFIGIINQKYPAYSSRPVNGKPLFMWAREGKLDEIEIPSHKVVINIIEVIDEKFYLGDELLSRIQEDISFVKGDFRQDEILKLWKSELKDKSSIKYPVITIRVSCGSGVYMRALANDIGEMIGIPALALNIKRTKIGEYNI